MRPVREGRFPGAALDHDDIRRAVRRIAHEIVEHRRGTAGLMLIGIPTRGVPIAERIAAAISSIEGTSPPVGSLDITLYRDDLRMRPSRALEPTWIPEQGVDAQHVVLVDDVLYSGRTIRAALDALSDLGRPATVQLAVLVDRGHRELPIRPDYVGKNLPTSASQQVRVEVEEVDGIDRVTIEDQARSAGGDPA
ncbi:MAG: bifunctional pyr operon transcriptional regulator/uracil phosphoribosyltransferase PyrR [Actinomycetales bacterium]|nr:bifunctional pyr operon transcriptional regulator/uracil phosphoribosyltransferase PyrR [Actinomycetales bacterium]